MAFTVEDVGDLVRILDEKPEWRSELRRVVLSDHLSALHEQIAESRLATERRIDAINAEIAELRAATERHTAEIAELRAATERHTAEIAELRAATERHTAEIAELRAATERHTAEIAELRAATERHTAEIAELRAATERHTAEIAELRAATERHTAEIVELRAATERHTAEVAELRAATERHTAEIAELRAATERHTEQIARLTRSVHSLSNDVGDLKGMGLEQRYRRMAYAYFGRFIRRTRVMQTERFAALVEDAITQGVLSDDEADELSWVDLVVSGKRRDTGNEVFLVAEISWTVAPHDVERAARRASLFARIRSPVLAVAAGKFVTEEAALRARDENVWVFFEGTVHPPDSTAIGP